MKFSGADNTGFRTRAVILSINFQLYDLAQEIFRFNDINADWASHEAGNSGDFIVLATDEVSEAADFKPTIVLISSAFTNQNWQPILENITPGGILIYPQVSENALAETSVFFRKLAYSPAEYDTQDNQVTLLTEFGNVPLRSLEGNLTSDILGLQLFCAQFGLMEEDFFATLAELH